MNARVLIDTGPLVAILSKRDQYHEECVQALKELEAPLLTCWPVLTEALWLLRKHTGTAEQSLGKFDPVGLALLPMDEASLPWIARFMRRYESVRPQLADASLMYLAEHHGIETIFTLDRRDFSVYRVRGRRSLRLIPER